MFIINRFIINFLLERRIEFDYEKFGDSPACLGEDMDIRSQTAVLQGFGLQADETYGELLELQLKTISNDKCYEAFENLSRKNSKTQIQTTLFEGITDQVLCTLTMCNGTDPNLKRRDKCVSCYKNHMFLETPSSYKNKVWEKTEICSKIGH